MSKRIYDYYTVNVPSDFSTDKAERSDIAFMLAEELTRIYAIPCEWRIVSDDGENVRVVRIRNAKEKGL